MSVSLILLLAATFITIGIAYLTKRRKKLPQYDLNLNQAYDNLNQELGPVNTNEATNSGRNTFHNNAHMYEELEGSIYEIISPTEGICNDASPCGVVGVIESEDKGLTSRYEQVPVVDIKQLLLSQTASKVISDVHYEQVKIFDISHVLALAESNVIIDGQYERAQVYELVPAPNYAQILSNIARDVGKYYGSAQVYERVPSVNIAQILAITDGMCDISTGEYGIYERVPTGNIAQILVSIACGKHNIPTENHYERAQVYECVPSIDIAQILADIGRDHYKRVQIYEQAPTTNVTQIFADDAGLSGEDRAQVYEQVPVSDTFASSRGISQSKMIQPQFVRYERVIYNKMMEQMLKKMPI